MKLIIDIDKNYYKIIKYEVENGNDYKPFEIIANGIPYEPEGDLISREALIKALFEHCRSEEEIFHHFWSDENLIALIDNAPTISPFKAIHDELHKGEEE